MQYSMQSTHQLILVGSYGGESCFAKDERSDVLRLWRIFCDAVTVAGRCSTVGLHQVDARLVLVHRVQDYLHSHKQHVAPVSCL